jgi:hypothetical protein
MIDDLKDFNLGIDHFMQVAVPENHHALMRRITLKLYDSVTDKMPTDTGWHRANWGVQIGRSTPVAGAVGTYPEEKRGQYQAMPRTAYFNAHDIVSITPLGNFPFIWLYNHAPGIEALEDGHSQQAPTGMLAHALNDLQVFVDEL